MMLPRATCRPGRTVLLLLPLCFLSAGCHSTNQELLESELRARDRQLRELREQVNLLECHNEALQRQLTTVYQQGSFKLSPEQLAQVGCLHRITIGRGTGGYDQDHQLGDEALQVVIEPRDGADHVIKAPGTVTITALEISSEGIKTPFSAWTVSPEQLRKSWKSGFFTTGYVLVLPFQTSPHSPQVRVVVRFQTDDGRLFEADRDVRVMLRPEVLGAPPSPEAAPLPVPRKLDVPPPPDGGPVLPPLEQTGVWQAPSLAGAVQLGRPLEAVQGP
jgi:hypothetical protein